MEMTLESLGLDKLTPQDKQLVAQLLWESIEGPDLPLSETYIQELDRRIREDDLHPDKAIPWEDFRKGIHAKFF